MYNACAVYQNVYVPALEYVLENGVDLCLIGDIACLCFGLATISVDFARQDLGLSAVYIENADARAAGGELFDDGVPDAAGSSGYDCGFVVQRQIHSLAIAFPKIELFSVNDFIT
jgi:hypothetical protein